MNNTNMTCPVGHTFFRDVGDFHRKFDLPYHGEIEHPEMLTDDAFLFRFDFMLEELHEVMRAHQQRDMAKFLDGLIDLVYVALGTAHLGRMPFDHAWMEVQRANMRKERATHSGDARSKRGHSLDVVKPEGWRPPNIELVISQWSRHVDDVSEIVDKA